METYLRCHVVARCKPRLMVPPQNIMETKIDLHSFADHGTMKREDKTSTQKNGRFLQPSAILVLTFCLWLAARPLPSLWAAQPPAKPSVAYG
ncbi:MAG TPA: hypothetical protein VIR02_18405, partial [Anaerolineales bacterium]